MKKHTKIILCSILVLMGCSKNANSPLISDINKQTIQAPNDINIFTSQDSLLSFINIIPLETKENCLISKVVSIKIKDSLIYINSGRTDLYVFDFDGNYKSKIGSKGQGPGEYLELRDFIFTKDGNIEILDFRKIETYSLDGGHLKTKRFDFLKKDLYSNPVNFSLSPISGYYIWGGMIGLNEEQLRGGSYMMHHMGEDMNITNSYFLVGNGDGGMKDRFRYYNDTILVIPYLLDYNVYQIDESGDISIRYNIDFGKYGITNKISSPEERGDISLLNQSDYVTNLSDYVESDSWIHVKFTYKNLIYSLLYSKEQNESYFVSMAKPFDNELRFYPVSLSHENKLVSIIDAYWLLEELDRITPEGIKRWNLEKYKNINESDNPVLIFYTLKKP